MFTRWTLAAGAVDVRIRLMSAYIRPQRVGALLAATSLALSGAAVIATGPAAAASPSVIITEVYGGGGNSGAPYTNDFVELTNNSGSAVDLTGWSVQYASATGVSWTNKIPLTGSIAPGGVYLVQGSSGANGQPLPTPDASGNVNMSATSGKVALVTSTTSLTCTTGCATAAGVVDFVGYGSANDAETSPAPGPSNTTSATRKDPTKDADNNATEFQTAAPSPKALTSTPPEPDPVDAKISDIQGRAHRSPLTGQRVGNVTGVVVAKSTNGFWFQDTEPDADPATSEGLFVFTGSAPATATAVGDVVSVEGTVTEFRPGGSGGTDNLTTTELTNAEVTVSGTAAVPAPTIVGPGGRVPPSTVIDDDSPGDVETTGTFEPVTDGLDFWESLEGMWLGMNEPSVTGPTSSFGELSVVAAGASVRTIRGGIVLRQNDTNPERVLLDDLLAPVPVAKTGDKLAGVVTGVLDYGFGNFKYLVTQTPTVIDGGLQRERTARTSSLQVSVATFNVENLDPGDGPAKFEGLATAIVKNLASPDILALEEVQDNDGATNSGTTAADVTLNTLTAAIRAAGGPKYAWRQIDPVNNAEGGEPGGNIRVAFLYRTDRPVKFVDRPGGGTTTDTTVLSTNGRVRLSASPGRVDPANPAWQSARVPLAAEFSWLGQSLFVVANHFSSKGGDDPLWGRIQPPVQNSAPKRHQQARVVRGFVDQILTKDPGANVIVLGDINDFEFSETADILVGSGRTELIDLPRTLEAPERYSYVFEGNSQILDHILMSKNLLPASSYDIVHMNSEFPDQISDHDPQVVRVVPFPSWFK
jgi:predicted extracellular nuclease